MGLGREFSIQNFMFTALPCERESAISKPKHRSLHPTISWLDLLIEVRVFLSLGFRI